jgi:hypothetical protein
LNQKASFALQMFSVKGVAIIDGRASGFGMIFEP